MFNRKLINKSNNGNSIKEWLSEVVFFNNLRKGKERKREIGKD